MVVRIVIGLVLVAFFALGGAVLSYGMVLHFQFADAGDPPIWAVQRSLWLTYLSALDLFWGVCAVSILWPGQRSSQLRWILSVGAIATVLSGGALLAVLSIYDAERIYMQLVGLILLSGIAAGFGQAWTSREASAEQAVADGPSTAGLN